MTEIYFLKVVEAWSPISRCQHSWSLDRALLVAYRWPSISLCLKITSFFVHWWRERKKSLVSHPFCMFVCILKNFVKNLLKYSWFIMLISTVEQSDSAIHTYIYVYIYIYIYIYISFFIIFSHYGLSQDIEYSSLCFIGGQCCLSILNLIVCTF